MAQVPESFRIDHRSRATRAAWLELQWLQKKIGENVKESRKVKSRIDGHPYDSEQSVNDSYDGERSDDLEFEDGDADMSEKLWDLEDERKQLLKQLDARILQCERDDLRKIADGIQKALGGATELRFAIYEFLCRETGGAQIPDFGHDFYHNHDSSIVMSWVGSGEDRPPEECYDDRMERAKERMEEVRNRYIFNKEFFGDVIAQEITQIYLGENVLHFRDARLMRTFIDTPFPCGYVPRDWVKDIVIYIRCEDFLEDAGWGDDDTGDAPGQPEEDYPWKEQGVYDKYRREIAFIQKTPFAKKPKVTLVIVTPFDRMEAEFIEQKRIRFNFVEMVLPTYRFFMSNKSGVKVVEKGIKDLADQESWSYDEDEDLTWQVKIMDEVYAQSAARHYTYPNARKTPQRTQFEDRANEILAQRPKREVQPMW